MRSAASAFSPLQNALLRVVRASPPRHLHLYWLGSWKTERNWKQHCKIKLDQNFLLPNQELNNWNFVMNIDLLAILWLCAILQTLKARSCWILCRHHRVKASKQYLVGQKTASPGPLRVPPLKLTEMNQGRLKAPILISWFAEDQFLKKEDWSLNDGV